MPCTAGGTLFWSAAVIRASSSLLLALILLSSPAVAQPAEDSRLEVHLLTMGPGDHLYTRGGHAALNVMEIHADGRRESRVYNYGDTSWEQGQIAIKWMTGRLIFFLSASGTIQDTVARYGRGQDRTLYSQQLALTQAQARDLVARLQHDIQPEFREYAYHHLEAVCTTKARDLLDEVLEGAIREQLESSRDPLTPRDHQEEGTWGADLVALASGLLIGRSHDRPYDKYYMAFLPARMRTFLREVRVPDPAGGAVDVPLAGPPLVLFQRRGVDLLAERNHIATVFGWVMLVLIGLLGLIAMWRAPASPRLAGIWLMLWALPTGVTGALISMFIIFSEVPQFRDNELILTWWPTHLGLLVVAWGWLRGRASVTPRLLRYAWTFFTLAAAVVALRQIGVLYQKPEVLSYFPLFAAAPLLGILYRLPGAPR